MSLPTRSGRAQPRVADDRVQRSSSAGKSTPAMQQHADLGDRPAPHVEARLLDRLVEEPLQHVEAARRRPRWCGELSGPRTSARAATVGTDEREIGLRVAAVDGEDDRRRHASASLPNCGRWRRPAASRLSTSSSSSGCWPISGCASSALRAIAGRRCRAASRRAARTRPRAARGRAAPGRAAPAEAGRGARAVDSRRKLDDVVVGKAGDRARVTEFHLVHVAVAA